MRCRAASEILRDIEEDRAEQAEQQRAAEELGDAEDAHLGDRDLEHAERDGAEGELGGVARQSDRDRARSCRRRREAPYGEAISSYVDRLDERRGAVFSSNYEYPGRYTRWDTAIIDPPLVESPPSTPPPLDVTARRSTAA